MTDTQTVNKLYTPRQVARALGVSEASLKRWCDRDLIPSQRTAGGHRRLTPDAVMGYLRRSGHAPVRPELLGLPANVGKGDTVLERAEAGMRIALEKGDEECLSRWGFDLYLQGHALSEICDRTLAPAFHGIGDRWSHGAVQVYQERRGCELAMRFLHQAMSFLPPAALDAPLAFGGTLSADPYTLPTAMVEIALREAGWRAESFGIGLPLDTLRAALVDRRPKIFWLSCSVIGPEAEFLAGYQTLYDSAVARDVAIVVGGRALSDGVRSEMRYSAYCDNLRHLVAFARTLHPPPGETRTSRPVDPPPTNPTGTS